MRRGFGLSVCKVAFLEDTSRDGSLKVFRIKYVINATMALLVGVTTVPAQTRAEPPPIPTDANPRTPPTTTTPGESGMPESAPSTNGANNSAPSNNGSGNAPAATPPPASAASTPDTTPPPPPPASGEPASSNAATTTPPPPVASTPAPTPRPKDAPAADSVPPGQELVNIDFPEPTEIKDIIRAVALWTGKNVILGKGVSGKVQMISPRKVTKEEAYQMFLSALNVLGLTTVETGKVIKILPVRNAVQGNLQIYQGSSWAPRTDNMITQIVPLKYIDAKQLQATLSRIVSTNSMIAYPPTNTLIISDTGFKVRRILAIIELLDVQGQQPQVALVPIKYADAKIVAQKVSEIMQASRTGGPASGAPSHKISVDERSNSVVIFGPPRTISDVKALVQKFDFPIDDPQNQAAIRVRFLDYADAKKLATTLSSLAQGGSANRTRSIGRTLPFPTAGSPAPAGGDNSAAGTLGRPVGGSSGAAPTADLGENVKITADESSNALLITGSRAAYNAINALIRKLDRRRAQVYVEADILDVTIGSDFNFGSSLFLGSGSANGTKMAYGWQASGVAPLIEAQQNPSSTTALGGALKAFGGTDFTIGVLSGAKVNVPGIGEVSPGALIKLLKKDTNSRVLSSPHLLTSNNEKAKILVGDKLFYKSAQSSVVSGLTSVTEKVEKEDVDLILELKPNVSHSGSYVTLDLNLQANDGTITSDGLPDVNKRQTQQIVTVKNGQTAVISGLVKLREQETFQKIPLLGDIPILGWLFRNTTKTKATDNLVIFLTPHIVYGANDLTAIYESKVKERDEIMAKAFDVEADHPFMAKLPTLEDGKYRADQQDELEQQRQKEFLQEIREDMGYVPSSEAKSDSGSTRANDSGVGEAVTVPMTSGGDDQGSGAVGDGSNIPPPPPPPPPPEGMDGGGDIDIPPPPPPPDMGSGDGAPID